MGLYSGGLIIGIEGYLHLRIGGRIFGRAFFLGGGVGGLLSEFYGIASFKTSFLGQK